MSVISPFVKHSSATASIIGIIQGIVWIVLSIIVIVIYSEAWKPRFNESTYGQLLSSAIINIYFNGTGKNSPTNLYVTPTILFVWAILYLIASIFWTFISSHLLWVLMEERYELLKKRCFEWAYWTVIVCLLDLGLASLLARDYDCLVGQLNLDPSTWIIGTSTYKVLAIGIMMTLAARGFLLWIVNFTFVVIIWTLPINCSQKLPYDKFNNSM